VERAALGLDRVTRLAWAKERRIVQAVRLEHEDGRTFLVANTHCTSSRDLRIPALELERAARFALDQAAPQDVVVLAGDFNVSGDAPALRRLTDDDWGFSEPGLGIDHVLVRGATVSELRVWPDERRVYGDVLLSDHAPVEVELS
jgi:endonuclease/exonuclease/phosphatase family metal-dependent hydrolase